MKSVAIFCGAARGSDPGLLKEVANLVRLLAENNIEVIYGGGKVGIMGLVADTAIQHNCKITGIIPEFLINKELAHDSLSELISVKSMSERKQIICEKADGFILLPGGVGSLDEFFDMLSQMHVGLITKKFGILNAGNYYDATLAQLHKAKELNFMSAEMYDLIKVGQTAEKLFSEMIVGEALKINRWE
ncbi:MAG: Rossman fold protein family [Gammaproteobacteria bacterium]|jgi:uncharacterized protein (TIGR00730 family)|nr:Rossman fold protein family [Gammaproteobacteria bacterium]